MIFAAILIFPINSNFFRHEKSAVLELENLFGTLCIYGVPKIMVQAERR